MPRTKGAKDLKPRKRRSKNKVASTKVQMPKPRNVVGGVRG